MVRQKDSDLWVSPFTVFFISNGKSMIEDKKRRVMENR